MPDLEDRFQENIRYCTDQVRQHDEDRYLSAQFAEAGERDRLMALYACAGEIARIPDMVSEGPLGAIRQQWWRDALTEIYDGGAVRAHPVVEALAVVLRAAPDPVIREGLEAVIMETGFFLEDDEAPGPEAIWAAVKGTHGRIAEIAAQLIAAPEKKMPSEERGLADLGAVALLSPLLPEALGSIDQEEPSSGPVLLRQLRAIAKKNPDGLLSFMEEKMRLPDLTEKKMPSGLVPVIAHASLIRPSLRRAGKVLKGQKKNALTMSGLEKRWRLFRAALSGRF